MKIYHSIDQALKAIHYRHNLEVIGIVGINNEAFFVKRSQPSGESYLSIASGRKLQIKRELFDRQVKSAIERMAHAEQNKENHHRPNHQAQNQDPIEKLIQKKYPAVIALHEEMNSLLNQDLSSLSEKESRTLKIKINATANKYKKMTSAITDDLMGTRDLSEKTQKLKSFSEEIHPELTQTIKENLVLMHAEERILESLPAMVKAYESAHPGKDIHSVSLVLSHSPCVGDHPIKNKQAADALAKDPNYKKKASTAKVINDKAMPEGCYEKLKLYFDEHKRFGQSKVEADIEILYLHKYESEEVCKTYGLFATQAHSELKSKLESVYSKDSASKTKAAETKNKPDSGLRN